MVQRSWSHPPCCLSWNNNTSTTCIVITVQFNVSAYTCVELLVSSLRLHCIVIASVIACDRTFCCVVFDLFV